MKVFKSFTLLHNYYVNASGTLPFGWTMQSPKHLCEEFKQTVLILATPPEKEVALLSSLNFSLTFAPLSVKTQHKYAKYGDMFKSEWLLCVTNPPTLELEQNRVSGVSRTPSDNTEFFTTLDTLFHTHFIPATITRYTLTQRGYRSSSPLPTFKSKLGLTWG